MYGMPNPNPYIEPALSRRADYARAETTLGVGLTREDFPEDLRSVPWSPPQPSPACPMWYPEVCTGKKDTYAYTCEECMIAEQEAHRRLQHKYNAEIAHVRHEEMCVCFPSICTGHGD